MGDTLGRSVRPWESQNVLAEVVERELLGDRDQSAEARFSEIPLDVVLGGDAAGVTWRVVETERPDADFVTQYRKTDANRKANEDDDGE